VVTTNDKTVKLPFVSLKPHMPCPITEICEFVITKLG